MKPGDGYIRYIINPKSGASARKLVSKVFGGYLVRKGFDVRFEKTSSLIHARELAAAAGADNNCKLVVAVGGDGTIREIAHGLEGSDKPMLIVPAGTENLLANELGFDERYETVIKAFEDWQVRPLDLGRANGRCFTSIAGFGFDGRVVKRVSGERDGHIDHLDYFWPIWRTFWYYEFPAMTVEADGSVIFAGKAMVFVGNISRYAMGLGILHKAEFSDGLLDVCVYKCDGKGDLIRHSAATIMKQHTRSKDVVYVKAKHIRVSSEVKDVETQLDGDPGPQLPVEIDVIPHAVSIIVPKGAKPAGVRTRLLRALG